MAVNIGVNIQRSANRIAQAVRESGVGGSYPDLLIDVDDAYFRANGGSKAFSEVVTHSRSGNATMVDSDGLIKWAPHNLLTYSEEFDNAAWATSANATLTADYANSPDGNQSAYRLEMPATGSTALFKSQTYTNGQSYTFSVWVKATSGTSQFDLYETSSGTPIQLGTQTATSEWQRFLYTFTASGTGSFSIGINNGNDSYASDILIWGAHLYRSDLGGMVDVPAGERVIPSASTYVPTTSSARYLPRVGHHVYNGSAWVNEGLLHESEARTNLLTNSFADNIGILSGVSKTTGQTNPLTGQTDAVILTASSGSGGHEATYATAFSAPTSVVDVCTSVFVEKGTADYAYFHVLGSAPDYYGEYVFNLNDGSIFRTLTAASGLVGAKQMGEGVWQLYIVDEVDGDSGTPSIKIGPHDGTNSATWTALGTETIKVLFLQVEEGSTPSSYIPTAGATVTRAAETLTIPSANLPWPTPQVIGDELVTNGTFDTDLTGWTNSSVGTYTATVTSGELVLVGTNSSNRPALYQQVAVESGKVYIASVDVTSYTSGDFVLGMDTDTSLGSVYASIVPDSSGTFTFVFVATADNQYLWVFGGSGGFNGAIDNISVREINPLSVSIQMDGRMTYADTGGTGAVVFVRWLKDANNFIFNQVSTFGGNDGLAFFRQAESGTQSSVSTDAFDPGILVPFNIALRHGSTFINGAVDGVALTANTTPTALPDLSSTDLDLGYNYMGTIKTFRSWDKDLGDTGIEEATAPSLEPSLELVFDGSESSFVVLDWEN